MTMEIATRMLDCLMGYKSALLRIKRKMLGDTYDDDKDDNNNDVCTTDE